MDRKEGLFIFSQQDFLKNKINLIKLKKININIHHNYLIEQSLYKIIISLQILLKNGVQWLPFHFYNLNIF